MANKVGEVSLYYIKEKSVPTVKVTSSQKAYEFLKSVYDERTVEYREFFYVLALNNSNEIIDYIKLSDGGITGCLVDVRLTMQMLLLKNATGFIVSHNHPSGTLKPSQADKDLTQKLKEAGRTLDIKLLDHVIYTTNGYFSFADESYL